MHLNWEMSLRIVENCCGWAAFEGCRQFGIALNVYIWLDGSSKLEAVFHTTGPASYSPAQHRTLKSSNSGRHCPLVTNVGIAAILRPNKASECWAFWFLPLDFRLTVRICINQWIMTGFMCVRWYLVWKKNLPFMSLDWFQAKGHDQVTVIVYDWISLRLYVQ